MTPETMWSEQVAELRRDLDRVQSLTAEVVDPHDEVLGASVRRLLSRERRAVASLEQAAKAGLAGEPLWSSLAAAGGRCRALCGTHLELLGGLAITARLDDGRDPLDAGMAARAEAWLDGLREEVGLHRELVVLPALDTSLEPDVGLVRIPFLDWDLWHLPLLGRVLGLQAEAEDGLRGGPLAAAAKALAPEVRAMLGGQQAPPAEGGRGYLRHLFADMFATAVVGPPYALAALTLELDLADPARLRAAEPDRVEGRAAGRDPLPSPVQRAAAMLATLTAMDAAAQPGPYELRPYGEVVGQLKALWRSAAGGDGAGLLEAALEGFGPWHGLLFEEVLLPQLDLQLEATRSVWEWARACATAWRGEQPTPPPPRPGALGVTEVLAGVWRYRIEVPDQADALHEVAEGLLAGRQPPVPTPDGGRLSGSHAFQARLGRLRRRWRRAQALLADASVRAQAGPAVTARFLRLLSEQHHHLDHARAAPAGPGAPSPDWAGLAELERRGLPTQREALEFLGGSLLVRRGLDREPAALSPTGSSPSVCALADRLLAEYADRTGVCWAARTVLGAEALLEEATDVIRVRFPDWSVWDLPLMAHEFGHLVARSTPGFTAWQGREAARSAAPAGGDEAAEQALARLEELFADVFAAYTLGPAFACDAILLHLNPAGADRPRGRHPAHGQRARAILLTLRRMDESGREVPAGVGPYAGAVAELEQTWEAAVAACRGHPGADPQPAADPEPVDAGGAGEELATIVATWFRLGAAYTPPRWRWAQKAAKALQEQVPSVAWLRARAAADGLGPPSIADLLNVMWSARLDAELPLPALTGVALRLGEDYLEGHRDE